VGVNLRLLSAAVGAALTLSVAVAQAQTLVVARGNDANSLDPAESVSFEAIKVADWTFDGLVRFDGNSHKIVPALAESWTISDDGKTWTFKLRQGVKFHDGTPFNAESVVFSLERQRDKAHPFHCSKCRRWSAKFSAITKTEAVDSHTVTISLKAPSPTLLVNLAFYIGYIVSPTAVKKDREGFRTNPVGTGPFKFVRWERDNFLEYQANADYYLGKPKVDRLVVRVIPDNDVRLLALKKGEVQLIYGVPFPQFDAVEQDPALTLHQASTLGISFLALNTEQKPMNDIRVRKAINHAINRERMFKTVFFGRGQMANQVIPPNWWGHSKDVTTYDYDPEKAKKLLAEAGFADGFKTKLTSWTNPRPYLPAPRDAVSLIKSDLAKVGIDVEVQTMKWSTFRQSRGKGDYGMTMGGWISGTLDPDGIIYALFHSRYIREKDALNWTRYRNEKLDAALEKARGIYDQKARDPLYQEVANQITGDAASVFFAHPITAIATRANLKNVFIHDSNWVPLHEAEFTK
jgi:peptide/nickel transport system substrate-binding protein